MPAWTKQVGVLNDGSGGWFYNLLKNGKLCVHQTHKPAVSGTQLMTEAQANALADSILTRLNAPRTQSEEAEFQTLLQKARSLTCPNCGQNVPLPPTMRITGGDLDALTPLEQLRVRELARKGTGGLSPEEVKQICEAAQTT